MILWIFQVYQDDPEISAMASLRTAYEQGSPDSKRQAQIEDPAFAFA